MSKNIRECDRISLFFSVGISEDVGENYILKKSGFQNFEIVNFSSKNLSWGHYCNWTMFLSDGEDWDFLQTNIVDFLVRKYEIIASIPAEFDRKISLESYLYQDFHFEVDFSNEFMKYISNLNIDFAVSSYFLRE